jgi:chromosome partitioning protein
MPTHLTCVFRSLIIAHSAFFLPTFLFSLIFFLFCFTLALHKPDLGEDDVIIAITNQKGGVGKTTTSLNIAAALAFLGHRVLLIDTDPQAHSTISAVSDPTQCEKSLYDILMHPEDGLETVITQSTIPGLEVAVSRIAMAKLEPSLLGEIDGHYRLKDIVEPIRPKYNHIIIDTPPTLGLITLNSLVAATHILIPIQPSYLCLEGTDDLLETIDKVKRVANPDLQVLGILITLHDKRTNIAKDAVRRIRKVFGRLVFRTLVSKSVKLEESPAYKESIFTYAPNSVGALQYRKIAEEIIQRGQKK